MVGWIDYMTKMMFPAQCAACLEDRPDGRTVIVRLKDYRYWQSANGAVRAV